MVNTRKLQAAQSIETLDRELIARGAKNLDEIFKFKDSVGTPQRDAIMRRIKDLYASAPSPSSNEILSQIDTWTLARGLINKIRKGIFEESRTRGMWYTDYRMDYFGIVDEKVKMNSESVAAVMLKDNLIEEKKGIFRIKVKNYGEVFNLWQGENFRDEPISAGPLCTGFLVRKDLIALPPHFVNERNVRDLRFVFGYRMLSPKTSVILIPENEIYKGIGFIQRLHYRLDQSGVGTDFAVVRLDREVEDREVLKLSQGKISGNYELYILGHPCGLPLKYAAGARIQHFNDIYFDTDLDIYMSSTGSPVFNSKTHKVIGMVIRDDTLDFRWTGKGWASIIYPNRTIRISVPQQCTIIVSGCIDNVIINEIDKDSAGVEKYQTSSPKESDRSKEKIFISYSHKDKNFVDSLTTALENAGMSVWVDEKEIETGDSISKKIEEGISGCDFFCLVLSGHSVKSEWVDREYRTALNTKSPCGKTLKILPLLIEDVKLPSSFLKDIKYADFSKDYESGLKQLLKAVKK